VVRQPRFPGTHPDPHPTSSIYQGLGPFAGGWLYVLPDKPARVPPAGTRCPLERRRQAEEEEGNRGRCLESEECPPFGLEPRRTEPGEGTVDIAAFVPEVRCRIAGFPRLTAHRPFASMEIFLQATAGLGPLSLMIFTRWTPLRTPVEIHARRLTIRN
jgi:hypothetical protein